MLIIVVLLYNFQSHVVVYDDMPFCSGVVWFVSRTVLCSFPLA